MHCYMYFLEFHSSDSAGLWSESLFAPMYSIKPGQQYAV